MKTQLSRISAESAELLAIQALGFLAENPEHLQTFLDLSGASPDDLRDLAGSQDFLTGVLDHLLNNEELLLEFAAHSENDPECVLKARDVLSPPVWD